MKNTHKLYTDVIAKSGSKNEPLEVTANGVYEAPKGTGYSPVKVNVPQTAESGTLKAFLDATKYSSWLFYGYKGTSIDDLIKYSDTSSVIDMWAMFFACNNLTTIPQLDTSNVTNMREMFRNCSRLISIPQLDTSKVTNMENMFDNCNNLTTIPQLDTSNVTNMREMFRNCSRLISIPQLDTSKVTNMENMFDNCNNLTTIPQLDTSNVTDMSYMFYQCNKLTNIPQLDTSKVTDMDNMFTVCNNLTTIPKLDASKATSFSYIFDGCIMLTSIGLYGFKRSIKITDTALGHDAIVAFLNQAGTAYNSYQKITMGSTKLALLSDEEKAIATNKGWTLA